jgi:hypothetical protein
MTSPKRAPKQAYERPKLLIYGGVSELTMMINPTGAKNDGGSGKQKTG